MKKQYTSKFLKDLALKNKEDIEKLVMEVDVYFKNHVITKENDYIYIYPDMNGVITIVKNGYQAVLDILGHTFVDDKKKGQRDEICDALNSSNYKDITNNEIDQLLSQEHIELIEESSVRITISKLKSLESVNIGYKVIDTIYDSDFDRISDYVDYMFELLKPFDLLNKEKAIPNHPDEKTSNILSNLALPQDFVPQYIKIDTNDDLFACRRTSMWYKDLNINLEIDGFVATITTENEITFNLYEDEFLEENIHLKEKYTSLTVYGHSIEEILNQIGLSESITSDLEYDEKQPNIGEIDNYNIYEMFLYQKTFGNHQRYECDDLLEYVSEVDNLWELISLAVGQLHLLIQGEYEGKLAKQ